MIRPDRIQDYKELKTLLVKSGAYYYFLENLAKSKFGISHLTQNLLHKYINETEPTEYINLAFEWAKSGQGYDFWADIDEEWLKIKRQWLKIK